MFNIIWISIILIILYVLKPKIRKIITIVLNALLLVFSIANYFLNSYFSSIFSWKDLALSRDGASFISSIFKFINLKLILFTLLTVILTIIIAKIKTKKIYKIKSIQTPILLLILALLLFGHNLIKKDLSNVSDGWNSTSVLNNDSNYYNNWIEPTRLIRISGTYEYIIRDFYFSYLKKDNIINAKNEVEKYINNYNKLQDEEKQYTGIFKDKNLLFIMLESMDDWLINEEVTPIIYNMMKHGFNFNNHYSPSYVTGDTANTEFIVNTGIYPSINKLSPNYAYVNNKYPFSIANLFKNKGYEVNSFHKSNGFIYNREKMYNSLGYTKYHNYYEMGISADNLDLDSYIAIDAYDKIVSQEKFMSFIITYSPHSPYTYDKIECQTNLDEIKKIYPDETNEEYLCAYSSARETDNMFKILLEKLEKDNLLENTVIVAFSDHPNHIKLSEEETDILNKTKFFIYESSISENQINKITSSINVLPTIINLFNIETDYIYPSYDALNTNQNYVIFKDYTYYDGKNITTLTEEMYNEVSYSSNILISDYYNIK